MSEKRDLHGFGKESRTFKTEDGVAYLAIRDVGDNKVSVGLYTTTEDSPDNMLYTLCAGISSLLAENSEMFYKAGLKHRKNRAEASVQ